MNQAETREHHSIKSTFMYLTNQLYILYTVTLGYNEQLQIGHFVRYNRELNISGLICVLN